MEPYINRPQPSPGCSLFWLVVRNAIFILPVLGGCGVIAAVGEMMRSGPSWEEWLFLGWMLLAGVAAPALLLPRFTRLLQALSQIEYMIADGMLQLRLGTVGRADIPLDEIEQASPVLDYFGIRNREMLNTSFANRIGPGVLLNLTTRHTLEHSGRQFWSLYLTPSDPQQFIAALQVRIAATNSTSA